MRSFSIDSAEGALEASPCFLNWRNPCLFLKPPNHPSDWLKSSIENCLAKKLALIFKMLPSISCFVLSALSTQRLSALSSWGHFGPRNFLIFSWLSEITSQRSLSFKMSVTVDFPMLYFCARSTLERLGSFSFNLY